MREDIQQLLKQVQLSRPQDAVLDLTIRHVLDFGMTSAPEYRKRAIDVLKQLLEAGHDPFHEQLDEQHEAYMTEWSRLLCGIISGLSPPPLQMILVLYDLAKGGAVVGHTCASDAFSRRIMAGVLEMYAEGEEEELEE